MDGQRIRQIDRQSDRQTDTKKENRHTNECMDRQTDIGRLAVCSTVAEKIKQTEKTGNGMAELTGCSVEQSLVVLPFPSVRYQSTTDMCMQSQQAEPLK